MPPTYDGFAIRPLYTAFDELPEPPLPGEWPYLRGGDAAARRQIRLEGRRGVSVPPGPQSAETNAAVLAALGDGVSALLIRVGESGVAPEELDELLEGVYLSMAPVILDAGADYSAACDAMLALVAEVEPDQRATLSIDLGADPLTAALSDRPAPAIEDVVAVATRVAGDRGVRAITVDGPAFHNLGANATWELAGSIAAAVAYLRVLTESGIPVGQALRQISFRLAADDDQFMTIAKMRAARQLWARVAEVVGEPDGGAAVVHAETSLPMMTQRDPWVNMLRSTLAAFGAGVGGADTVLVFPFDVAIPGGFPGTARSFARRIARNTQLLLLGGVTRRPGAGPRRRVVVRRGPHRTAGPAGLAAFPGDRGARRIRRRPRLRCRPDRRDSRAPRRRHRASPDRDHRRQRISQPVPNLLCRKVIRKRSRETWRATPPGSRRCATARTPSWPAPGHVRRCCCCRWARWPSTTSGRRSPRTCWPRAASRRSTRDRSMPAGSPRPSPNRRGLAERGGDLRHRQALPGRGRGRRGGGPRRRRIDGSTWPDRRKQWAMTTQHRPDEFLTAKINAVEALSNLLTRLGA